MEVEEADHGAAAVAEDRRAVESVTRAGRVFAERVDDAAVVAEVSVVVDEHGGARRHGELVALDALARAAGGDEIVESVGGGDVVFVGLAGAEEDFDRGDVGLGAAEVFLNQVVEPVFGGDGLARGAARARAARVVEAGQIAFVVLVVEHVDLTELAHVGGALRRVCGLARLLQRGQQDRGQNGDDGDDDEKFDQRELATGFYFFHFRIKKDMRTRPGEPHTFLIYEKVFFAGALGNFGLHCGASCAGSPSCF